MKREEQRVLAGSLNLLPPSDKLPENDAIELFGFRVDQAGVLRVGDSYTALKNILASTAVHTLVRLTDLGSTNYETGSSVSDVSFPANTFLVGLGTRLILYYGSTGNTLNVANGFDGNPLSIVFWNGFIWVMNQAKQLVLDPLSLLNGSAVIMPVASPWSPAPPSTAITAADSPSVLGNMTNGTTYTYFATFSYSFVDGSGTTVQGESSAGPTVSAVAADGQIYVDNIPQPNQQLLVSGWVGPVTLSVNVYRTSPSQTTPYRIPYATNATAFQDTYSDAQLLAWNQTQGSAGTPQPAAPSTTPTLTPGPYTPSGSSFAGNTYQYYTTFVSYTGLETNPGPVSQPVTTTEGSIALSTIPTSSDAQVCARRVYRTGGTLGGAYQATEIRDNTTTTYLDVLSDLVLTETGILMPGSDPTIGDNSPPPAALGCAGPYLNYLLAWVGNRLFWSQNGVPLFPGSGDPAVGNWVNVGAADDHIMGLTIHDRVVVIYKQRSIWRLLGDPVTGILGQTSATIGTLGPRSFCNAGEADYFLSADGLFLFDLDLEHRVSQNLDPVFMGVTWPKFGASDIGTPSWTPGVPVCAWLNGTVLISDGEFQAFLYHADSKRFARVYTETGLVITAVCAIGSAYDYFIGDYGGNICTVEQSVLANQLAIWQTRFLDQGLGDQPKAYSTLVLDAELNGATAIVYAFPLSANQTAKSNFVVGTITGTARQKFYIDLQSQEGLFDEPAPHISVRVEITCVAGAAPAIHALYIYYEVEARATETLTTLPFALDPERGVWQVKEVEYDLANASGTAGSVSAALSTDSSAASLAVVETDTLTLLSSGAQLRRNYLQPQNTSGTGWWTGRLFQIYLSSSKLFRLYGARMLARKVGTYIEGYEATGGLVWDSWWLTFGSVQVKVFDQIKLEIESSATLTVTVSTELPGETPATVATATIACTGPRRWYTIELPVNCIGRDIRVQIAANGAWTFYSGKVSMRIEGRYLSSVQGDQFRTLEQDFGTERVKWAKKLELDVNGTITLNVFTDEPNGLAQAFTRTISATGGRATVRVNLPPNIRGRLWRIDATTSATAVLYAIRGWMRTEGEASDWAWQSFALEPSETLPAWADLPVAPTPEEWTWVPVPLEGLPSAD